MDSENHEDIPEFEDNGKKEEGQTLKIDTQDGSDAADEFAYYREIASELRNRKEQILLGGLI